jgi:peptidoglycan/xylan/chitin deacetylase (PgdA/CDA1 family)
MRRVLSKTLRTGLRTLATVRSFLPAAGGARVVTYHSVRPDGHGPRSSYVHPDDFAKQIGWLVQSGYRVVPLSDLADRLAAGQVIPERWACITFDDGYADNYQYAFPVLRHYGVPATVFLVTGKINHDPEFITYAQMAEMRAHGIEFGGHTVDHVSLSSVAPAEARQQILTSKQQLDAMLGAPGRHFCYPFGHYNATVEGFVREAGFQTCCTEQAGPVRPGSDPLRLLRVGVLGTDTLQDFSLKVRGAYDWWINTYMHVEEWRRRRRGGEPA